MPTLIDVFDVKRSLLIWLIVTILWILRLASKPVWVFGGLLILSSSCGLFRFGRLGAAGLSGIACTGFVWLLVPCERQLPGLSTTGSSGKPNSTRSPPTC